MSGFEERKYRNEIWCDEDFGKGSDDDGNYIAKWNGTGPKSKTTQWVRMICGIFAAMFLCWNLGWSGMVSIGTGKSKLKVNSWYRMWCTVYTYKLCRLLNI